ncbi:MAG TPA: Spy/CpxP family protein refolding chaperone [Methylomirabilota bacterium]
MARRTHLFVAAGALGALVMAGIPAAAQGPGGGRQPRMERGWRGPGPGGFRMPAEFRRLDLTDAQRSQLRAVMEQHRGELQAVGERLRTAQQAVNEAVTAPVTDESLIRQRVSERALVEADAAVLRARLHAAAWQILTPEQQQKAQELKAERQTRREERRQRFEQRRQQRQPQAPQPQ